MKVTMKDRIYTYMCDFGSITTFEAFAELGCTRLSEYIRQLREEFRISDKWESRVNRYGEKVEFKRYSLAWEDRYNSRYYHNEKETL